MFWGVAKVRNGPQYNKREMSWILSGVFFQRIRGLVGTGMELSGKKGNHCAILDIELMINFYSYSFKHPKWLDEHDNIGYVFSILPRPNIYIL